MNHYPWWKNALIALVIGLSALYALPNLFGEDVAVQVSARRDAPVDQRLLATLDQALAAKGVSYEQAEFDDTGLVLRFADEDVQLLAKDVLSASVVSDDYTVALTLAASTPEWLRSLGANPMKLGLDLRGGVHFLFQVDVDESVLKRYENYREQLRAELRTKRVRYRSIQHSESGLRVIARNSEAVEAIYSHLRSQYPDLQVTRVDGADEVTAEFTDAKIKELKDYVVSQNITTLRNRVNELGVSEPIVQRQGASRIVVELPGIQDPGRAKEILGKTATLEFRLVDADNDVRTAVAGRVPLGSKIYYRRDGSPVLLKKQVMLTGNSISGATAGFDENNAPAAHITLDGSGGRQFYEVTKQNINRPMAVVFIEQVPQVVEQGGELITTFKKREEVINVATIRDALAHRFQITGLDSSQEANELALLLRAGALAAPVSIIEERTVGPTLGEENIKRGLNSMLLGMFLVLVFMLAFYKVFGIFANVALVTNVVVIVAVMSILGATLTLPGIAGVVLTVGMAVDANVLIFQRIKEELRQGSAPQVAINAGYARAFSTIADANITTLLAAVVLFAVGTGPIKGFAITLAIGIVSSMFTAILVTRALANVTYGRRRRLEALSI